MKKILIFLVLLSCQSKETKVTEKDPTTWEKFLLYQKEIKDVVIKPETIILDVRSRLDFELSHLQNSIWEDVERYRLSSVSDNTPKKIRDWIKHFALIGINQKSHVLIIGSAAKGKYSEGVLRWALSYVGVENIQMTTFEKVQKLSGAKFNLEPQNQEVWEPLPMTNLEPVPPLNSVLKIQNPKIVRACIKPKEFCYKLEEIFTLDGEIKYEFVKSLPQVKLLGVSGEESTAKYLYFKLLERGVTNIYLTDLK